MRLSPKVAGVLPVLYLRGLSGSARRPMTPRAWVSCGSPGYLTLTSSADLTVPSSADLTAASSADLIAVA